MSQCGHSCDQQILLPWLFYKQDSSKGKASFLTKNLITCVLRTTHEVPVACGKTEMATLKKGLNCHLLQQKEQEITYSPVYLCTKVSIQAGDERLLGMCLYFEGI